MSKLQEGRATCQSEELMPGDSKLARKLRHVNLSLPGKELVLDLGSLGRVGSARESPPQPSKPCFPSPNAALHFLLPGAA